ncbi:hypothetical protein BH23PLA1_BH23PLA1_36870 [soil metagenome]
MNNSALTNPTKPTKPIQPFRVRRHPVKWEQGDPTDPAFTWLADLTYQAIEDLGQDIRDGCHFVCPCVTISSREPTAVFFLEVLNRRGSWLRTFRHAAGNRNPRQLAKALGPSARQAILSGILFIDGDPVPPHTWQAQADQLRQPSKAPQITTTHHCVDLSAFKATGDPEPLKQMARQALLVLLDASPGHAAFITPQRTISAPTATPDFYAAARQYQAQWCTLLNRTLGCGNVRRARRAADIPTVTLVYSGTLLVDGQVFLPQCWPIHAPKPGRLKKTPLGSPTVPPEFLGLNP